MLCVEDRFMIKDLHRRGVSISEIARRTGHDRKTVRAVIQQPVASVRPPHAPRTRKLDPYVPYLQRRIEEGVLNGAKLYQEIQAQGYDGHDRAVRAFVQPYRDARAPQATVRFETEPGQQVQVDWGHFGLIQHRGRQRQLYAFVMTLGWSRTMYLEFTVSADLAIFLRCHVHAWHYFGGVPRQVLHDNLKTAVIDRDGEGAVHFHPRYLDFADYYGFSPRACQPYRAQTKGKVENGVRYVRGNFWAGLSYHDLTDLNRQGRTWLDTIANVRIHGTTRIPPFERLSQENLVPLGGKPDYDTSLLITRRCSRDCLISYGGNYYSVPAAYVQQALLVKHTEADEVVVFNPQGQEIARHALAEGRHQRIIVAAHYAGVPTTARSAKRPTARQVPQPSPAQSVAAPEVETRPLRVYDEVWEVAS
ncbi:MAG: IS21 family transposase [Anaerolineae bacterium]|nr:IS21 family transposase [Anaerolineae bacterium]